MKLDVQVRGKNVAKLYREGDEYLLKYVAGTLDTDFVSLGTRQVHGEILQGAPWHRTA